MSYLGQIQNLDWASPSRIFATTVDLFNSQPNYEHEVAIALDTRIKYQGAAPVIGGWRFATGAPASGIPVVPPPVNDSRTKILLEFDGIEGSTTYTDTNGAKIPRKWTQRSGLGHITNVGEKFYSGALLLDGKTVITSPDDESFDFKADDFAIRGWFLCDFPAGTRRTLIAKSDDAPIDYVFWIDRDEAGKIEAGVNTRIVFDHAILDRLAARILDRGGDFIIDRFDSTAVAGQHVLHSQDTYTNTTNTGWHQFSFSRTVNMLNLTLDGGLDDASNADSEVVNMLPGPITIGGYGPPKNGVYNGNPWIGGLDRFAVDIGIAR
jgi:hypothetical protein